MARNTEIKARLRDIEASTRRAADLASKPVQRLRQRDTFFHTPRGRLKLRELDSHAELIRYERPDARGPKVSSYSIVTFARSEADTLRKMLTTTLGLRGEVRKTRDLFLVGRTRIHLDRVEGLGDFLELEVVLQDGESVVDGQTEAEGLMEALGVAAEDLVEGAYIDLLESPGASGSSEASWGQAQSG